MASSALFRVSYHSHPFNYDTNLPSNLIHDRSKYPIVRSLPEDLYQERLHPQGPDTMITYCQPSGEAVECLGGHGAERRPHSNTPWALGILILDSWRLQGHGPVSHNAKHVRDSEAKLEGRVPGYGSLVL